MQKKLFIVLTLMSALLFTACGGAAAKKDSGAAPKSPAAKEQQNAGIAAKPKVLVAYFSLTGNTKSVAEVVHKAVPSDIFEIKGTNTYPKEYRPTTVQAKEELAKNFRPSLTGEVKDFKQYDVIFLGYPCWWGTMPMACFTFLEKYDTAGKIIIPFDTHEGSGMGKSEQDIKKLAPKAKVLQGLAVRGSSAAAAQEDINSWLKSLGYVK